MSASGMIDTRATPSRRPPLTPQAFLDDQESQAIQRIVDSVQRLGEDLCVATDIRGRIRRHPLAATGLGVLLGYAGGPLILRAFAGLLAARSLVRSPVSLPPRTVPGLVMTSLRLVRPRD